MSSEFFTHGFDAPITIRDFGTIWYPVVVVPADVIAAIGVDNPGRVRVDAEIEDHPLNAALLPDGTTRYLIVSQKVLRQIGKSIGDDVSVRFRLAGSDVVEVPAELLSHLVDSDLLRQWDALSVGSRRGLVHLYSQSKTDRTRLRRLSELRDFLEGRTASPLARKSTQRGR